MKEHWYQLRELEAEQFNHTSAVWPLEVWELYPWSEERGYTFVIATDDGTEYVQPGDWIVRDLAAETAVKMTDAEYQEFKKTLMPWAGVEAI